MMKLLLLVVMLGGAFFWGYCTGHQPGSPDILGIARDNYQKVSDSCATLKELEEKLQAANSQEKLGAQTGQDGQESAAGQDKMVSPAPVAQVPGVKVAGKTRRAAAQD